MWPRGSAGWPEWQDGPADRAIMGRSTGPAIAKREGEGCSRFCPDCRYVFTQCPRQSPQTMPEGRALRRCPEAEP